MGDLFTTLVIIVVILLLFQLSKKHDLALVTSDGKLERIALSLAGGYLAWVAMDKFYLQKNSQVTTGGEELDNVLQPSDLSLDQY